MKIITRAHKRPSIQNEKTITLYHDDGDERKKKCSFIGKVSVHPNKYLPILSAVPKSTSGVYLSLSLSLFRSPKTDRKPINIFLGVHKQQ